jgi:carbon starvation protein
MILEGGVAVLALATVMMLARGDSVLSKDPNFIYANGIARYLGFIGISYKIAVSFALLAFSTFVYDTLDVCTRLGRYVLQEFFGWSGRTGAFIATLLTLAPALAFLMLTKDKGYLVAWTVFGTSNQLLAALTLLGVAMWLAHTGRKVIFAVAPMLFMLVVTLTSLWLLIKPFLQSLFTGAAITAEMAVSGIVGVILLVLALWVVAEAVRLLAQGKVRAPITAEREATSA